MGSTYKKIIGKGRKLPVSKVIVEGDDLPAMSDVEALDMVEKMKESLGDDAKMLIELLLHETGCFTKDGDGRIKKSEIIDKTGWKSRKVDEVLDQCKDFIMKNM
jgi:hypothetical protein